MQAESMKRMVERACPFARNNRMKIIEAEEGLITLMMEDNPDNLNAFGLVHAGAICGLVETAGGMALFSHLDPGENIALNTVLNIRFVSMPRGDLTCRARMGADEARALFDELAASGRADKAMDIKVFDSSGKTVAQAQATFRVMPTPGEFKEHFGAMASRRP